MSKVRLHYNICDCEHEGDIQSAINEVEQAGGTYQDFYWDGQDCGEAFVTFTCERHKAEEIKEKLGESEVW